MEKGNPVNAHRGVLFSLEKGEEVLLEVTEEPNSRRIRQTQKDQCYITSLHVFSKSVEAIKE